MGRRKKVISEGTQGAVATEVTEDDLLELNEEVIPEEEEAAIAEPEGEDLPEGSTKEEAEKAAESEVDPEVELLKKHGLYRPDLIETVDQALGSLRWHEKHQQDLVERTRDAEAVASRSAPDPQTTIQPLLDGLDSEDPMIRLQTMYKIARAASPETEIQGLKKQIFRGSHTDFSEHEKEVDDLMLAKGYDIEDAYLMVRGRHAEDVASDAAGIAVDAEKRRQQERQLAQRERPGAVSRSSPLSVDDEIKRIAADPKLTEMDRVNLMEKLLDQRGMGLKE